MPLVETFLKPKTPSKLFPGHGPRIHKITIIIIGMVRCHPFMTSKQRGRGIMQVQVDACGWEEWW